MPQTILSVVLDVDPHSARHLSDLIEAFKRQQEEEGTETYGRLKDGVPSLHFLSMSVFQGAHYDPIFVIEANFDGSPDAFWGHVEATLADRLRPMLRCCKRPADNDGPAYDAVTKPDSRAPVVAYLRAGRCAPASFIRATGDSSGTGSCASGISSWPSGTSLRKPARQRQIPIGPFRRSRSTSGCATPCCGRFRGWRNRRRREFPGPSERRIFAGCSLSCLPLSSAFQFPAWRWRLSPRPGGSRS